MTRFLTRTSWLFGFLGMMALRFDVVGGGCGGPDPSPHPPPPDDRCAATSCDGGADAGADAARDAASDASADAGTD